MYKIIWMWPHNTDSPCTLLKVTSSIFLWTNSKSGNCNYFFISTQYVMSLSETIPVSLCSLIFTPHENTCPAVSNFSLGLTQSLSVRIFCWVNKSRAAEGMTNSISAFCAFLPEAQLFIWRASWQPGDLRSARRPLVSKFSDSTKAERWAATLSSAITSGCRKAEQVHMATVTALTERAGSVGVH